MRLIVCVAALAVACSPAKKKAGGGKAGAPPPTVDTQADQAAVAKSWLATLQTDAGPLIKLAEANAGWKGIFANDPVQALADFESGAKAGDVDAKVGYTRAALELAGTHLAVGQVVVALTPALMKAQATRPKAAESKPWRDYILARHAAATGKPPAAELVVPEGASPSFEHRRAIRTAVAEGRLKEAQARLKRVDPKAVDLATGSGDDAVSFRDPLTAGVTGLVYAAMALETVKDVPGWPQVLAAEAEFMLGRPAEAVKRLTTLLAAQPAEPALSQLVLSPCLTAEDLRAYATALKAGASRDKAAAEKLPTTTIAHRVFRAWALAASGAPIDPVAFPADRGELTRAITTTLDAQAVKAGATDVAELLLVDRYADALQRLFASALELADKPALAVRMREGAEDKAKAATPSTRNALSALTASARAYVGIRQPRVALKYLTRMGDRVPETAGAVEMLRDVLSLRAMGQGGGAATGQ